MKVQPKSIIQIKYWCTRSLDNGLWRLIFPTNLRLLFPSFAILQFFAVRFYFVFWKTSFFYLIGIYQCQLGVLKQKFYICLYHCCCFFFRFSSFEARNDANNQAFLSCSNNYAECCSVIQHPNWVNCFLPFFLPHPLHMEFLEPGIKPIPRQQS